MADDSGVKMEALKKAYAEIILNTSKEAAARVMAAERKALGFHHDLVSLKDESLRMFLRLKENFNSKIAETEAISFNQQLKIEELEAQLSEAEGIIVDLRYELKQVQEKLEAVKHNQKQHPLRGHVLWVDEPAHTQEHVLQGNNVPTSTLTMSPVSDGNPLSVGCESKLESQHPMAQTNRCCHTMNSDSLSCKSCLDQLHADSCDFVSIIMENSETELYRNGCTQRVRAFDRNLSNINLPSPNGSHQTMINVQSEIIKEKAAPLATEGIDSGQQDHQANTTAVGEKKRGYPCEESNVECLKIPKTSSKASGDDDSFREARIEMKNVKKILSKSEGSLLHGCTSRDKDQTTNSPRRSARKNSRYREAIAVLKRSSRKNGKRSHQQQPLLTQDRPKDTEFCCTSLSDEFGCNTVDIKVNCGDVVSSGEDPSEKGSRKGFCEKSCGHISLDVMMGDDVQLFDVPISDGLGTASAEKESQGPAGNDRDRPLKFTFQRRRRKDILNRVDGGTVVHGSTAEIRAHEKPIDDCVGVMQVAHQLVSLSGNGS